MLENHERSLQYHRSCVTEAGALESGKTFHIFHFHAVSSCSSATFQCILSLRDLKTQVPLAEQGTLDQMIAANGLLAAPLLDISPTSVGTLRGSYGKGKEADALDR